MATACDMMVPNTSIKKTNVAKGAKMAERPNLRNEPLAVNKTVPTV